MSRRSGGLLQRKVALITGAASGIGRAMALLFSRQGATVIAVDIDEPGLASLRETAIAEGIPLQARVADASHRQHSESTVADVVDEYRRLDVLCNNAGTIRRGTVLDIDAEQWERDLAVNLTSVFLWSRAALPQMIRQGGGVILNTGSGWGLTGGQQAASYCASKGAVVQLTRAMAVDHGRQGVRVNCLCPGDTDTPLLQQEARQLGQSAEEFLAGASERPLGRIGSPDEIARAALFLVSDEASYVTGATLVVDGGGLAGS